MVGLEPTSAGRCADALTWLSYMASSYGSIKKSKAFIIIYHAQGGHDEGLILELIIP